MRVNEGDSFRVGQLVLSSCLAALLATPAWGVAPSRPCSTPSVFRDAAVNVVILPYLYTGRDFEGMLSLIGQRLSFLVQFEAFFSMIKYGSVGAVRLVEDGSPKPKEGCHDPDLVLAQLLGEKQGAAEQVVVGRGLVLLWGRIYVEEGNIFVQSYARFLRRGIREELTSQIGNRRFLGKLPFQAVAFAPRQLTLADLQAIEREFLASAVIHAEPNEASRGEPLPLEPHISRAYGVVEVREGWIRVVSYGSGPEGWIRASLTPVQWPLLKKMPELSFVDGVVGYLRYQVGELGTFKAPNQTATWAAEALGSYRETSDPVGEATAVATSHLLAGYLSILRSDGSTSDLLLAQRDFERASELVPYSADARNLDLMTRIRLAYKGGKSGLPPRRVADELLQAAALEPQNEVLLENLESFYRLLGTTGPPPDADPSSMLEGAELQERLRFIQSVERPRTGRPAQK